MEIPERCDHMQLAHYNHLPPVFVLFQASDTLLKFLFAPVWLLNSKLLHPSG